MDTIRRHLKSYGSGSSLKALILKRLDFSFSL